MPTDFYDVLGAPADASQEELKRAYRGRVREYHPDVHDHPEGDAQFKLIREAHDVLSDPAERKDYDRMSHREYVEKRLDDLPPLSVFPEAEDEEPSDSASETTTDPTHSVSSPSRSSERHPDSSQSGGSTSASSSTRSARSQSTDSSRSSGRSGSRSRQSSSSSQSTRTDRTTNRSRSRASGRSSESTSAGAERSSTTWDDVTEQTARSGAARSSTSSAAARRRRGLRRWYGVVLLSLLAYLAGIGTYAAPYTGTLSGLMTQLMTTPIATLTAEFPLPSPTTYVLGTATAAASGEPGVGLLFVVGIAALPIVVLTAVAQFGQGSAWTYALASLGPVLPLAVARFAPLPTALALVGLVVLPLFSGFGFLLDVGRYLYATR